MSFVSDSRSEGHEKMSLSSCLQDEEVEIRRRYATIAYEATTLPGTTARGGVAPRRTVHFGTCVHWLNQQYPSFLEEKESNRFKNATRRFKHWVIGRNGLQSYTISSGGPTRPAVRPASFVTIIYLVPITEIGKCMRSQQIHCPKAAASTKLSKGIKTKETA